MTEAERMDAIQRLHVVKRLLDGARYDLTRKDSHPNDIHKALAKIDEARTLAVTAKRVVA